MSKQDILQAKDKDLSRMAGAFLGEKYDNYLRYCSEVESEDKELGYGKVDRPLSAKLRAYEMHVGRQIDPIPLTPANAFKWRDWACETVGYHEWKKALGKVHTYLYLECAAQNNQFFDYIEWLELKIEPKHYIKAAVICKIESEQSNE